MNDTDYTNLYTTSVSFETRSKPLLQEDMQIGSLVLVRRNGSDAHGKALWRCRCLACGNTKYDARADNLKAGRTKSCGCLKNATTTGRRNQMSKVLAVAGVLTRFRVIGYIGPYSKQFMQSKGLKGRSRMCAWGYAVIFVHDPARSDCYHGDMTKYYTTVPVHYMRRPGNQSGILTKVMRSMLDIGWIAPRGDACSVKRWAEIEGVTFEANKLPSDQDIFNQQKQMSRAAHAYFRGITV